MNWIFSSCRGWRLIGTGAGMGHGFGFYDRLLSQIRPEIAKIGLGFECQIIPRVPTEPHDVPLDTVVTEAAVYSSGTATC